MKRALILICLALAGCGGDSGGGSTHPKTEWRIQTLVMWSERALEKAQLAWNDIDRILLVGGSSRRVEPVNSSRASDPEHWSSFSGVWTNARERVMVPPVRSEFPGCG